jgi:hypothetical protein
MVTIGTTAVKVFTQILTGAQGLSTVLAEMQLEESAESKGLADVRVVEQHIASDLAERSSGTAYPMFYVYCERIRNLQREKFRLFSGSIKMVIEVRVSHDRLEQLQTGLHILVDAVVNILSRHTGMLAEGICYGGRYDIAFSAVKRGGKNYLQSATVEFDLDVSRD